MEYLILLYNFLMDVGVSKKKKKKKKLLNVSVS